jgi:pimeloyl-[acyl-carrier protein] methyl ester esterase
MRSITLSGWGQPYDALQVIAPEAQHIDYLPAGSVPAALEQLSKYAHAQMVIGWSMGGQLALQAIAKGVLAPEKLVLIATPFQFAQDTPGGIGMGAQTLAQFRANLQRDITRTLNKSYALIAHGDSKAEPMQEHLNAARSRLVEHDWLYWLDSLSLQTAHGVDFSRFPPTLLLHGAKDVVVQPEQSHVLASSLPKARVEIFEECGHAPHWHDTVRVRRLIEEHKAW